MISFFFRPTTAEEDRFPPFFFIDFEIHSLKSIQPLPFGARQVDEHVNLNIRQSINRLTANDRPRKMRKKKEKEENMSDLYSLITSFFINDARATRKKEDENDENIFFPHQFMLRFVIVTDVK